jgi:hypothetical protein
VAQNPVSSADARAWMIEHFQIPPQAKITYWFASGNPVQVASITWELGVETHTRSYDFRSQAIVLQIDL